MCVQVLGLEDLQHHPNIDSVSFDLDSSSVSVSLWVSQSPNLAPSKCDMIWAASEAALVSPPYMCSTVTSRVLFPHCQDSACLCCLFQRNCFARQCSFFLSTSHVMLDFQFYIRTESHDDTTTRIVGKQSLDVRAKHLFRLL